MKTFWCFVLANLTTCIFEVCFLIEVVLIYATGAIFGDENGKLASLVDESAFWDSNRGLLFLMGFGVSLIPAIIAAVYAYRNINEFLSRRFLFRSSNVDIYSHRLKYSFRIFVEALFTFTVIILIGVYGVVHLISL